VVVDADHVAGKRLGHDLAVRGHEGQRVGQLHFLAAAHMQRLHPGLEAARADAHESDAVAVLRIHVGLDLEHEAGELLLAGCTSREVVARALGAGACSTKKSSSNCTPKLLTAEPKNTGVCFPDR
jgi:hypothetical protein